MMGYVSLEQLGIMETLKILGDQIGLKGGARPLNLTRIPKLRSYLVCWGTSPRGPRVDHPAYKRRYLEIHYIRDW